jgi:hypothetical protein
MEEQEPSSKTSSVSELPKWKELLAQRQDFPVPALVEDIKPRKAFLNFKENFMYKIQNLLTIEFKEAGRRELMKKVQERFSSLQVFSPF